jgi:hypothetical protein
MVNKPVIRRAFSQEYELDIAHQSKTTARSGMSNICI